MCRDDLGKVDKEAMLWNNDLAAFRISLQMFWLKEEERCYVSIGFELEIYVYCSIGMGESNIIYVIAFTTFP